MATDNPDFELGDEYTGPAVTADGRVINTDDGTYVEGGVRYVWTGEGDNFMPEGGWSDTPEQLAADELYAPGGELNPLDDEGNPLYTQVIRADGSVQPGAWSNNPDFYVAQERPADFDAVDSQNRRKWIVGTDRRGNPTWTFNPNYNKSTAPGATPGGGQQDGLLGVTDAFPEGKTNALDVVRQIVTAYGLPISLVDKVWGLMKEARSPAGVAFEIRKTDEYKARFPGMQARQDLGLPAITEATYMELERNYRGIFRAAGLPANFSDGPEDFAAFIAGDVSPAEVQTRVALAEQARDVANQDIVYQLKDFYDLTDGDLTAYYLNPELASNIFEERRRMGAATLATASARATGTGLSQRVAERAEAEDISSIQLSDALAKRRGLMENIGTEGAGSQGVGVDTITEAEFGLNAEAAARVRRRREERTSPFAGSSGTLSSPRGFATFGAADE